ncbi:hypothetical protein BK703_16745 [Bacillus thuringiensis serovar silo]|uniref:hypothetical protein n=1 Tax=Bacillus thuringiensis TaxID=1428 RepID=UPI000A39D59C|nr:hypothetical protein [Bacillus thuringiensis]MED3275424.1 hypothetical protein [Bacillus thuringiensis]OTW55286.1 hypothetical protein BK703_16745 [Bacillus thuringiensis serovar silo]OTW74282.1 hypothetical protein BK700_01300 [Bacillus thuringiensis serovar toguchini]
MTKVYVGASALKEMESKKLQFEENANSDYGVVYFIENGKLMGTNKSNGKTHERQPELDFYTTQRFVEFNEFKKGSIVVVIDETYSNSIPVGTIGEVTEDHVAIDNTLRVTFTDIHGVERSAWFFPRRLRMASNEETKVFESAQRAKEFAEGKYARVMANDETRRMYGAHAFETGEIIKLVERYDSTGYRGESVKRSTKSSIRIEDMEIVEETVALKEMAKNATTGDIVYITKDNGNSYTSVGDIVKVTKEKYNGTAVDIEKADGSRAGFKYKENVRMATEAEKEKFEQAREDARLTIKEGDFARVIKNDSFRIGDVVRIGEFDGMHFEAYPVNGAAWQYIDKRGEVEKITEEEYNEAKRKEDAKKVERGNVVVVTKSTHRISEGQVAKVRTRCTGHIHLNDAQGKDLGSVTDGLFRLATSQEQAEFAKKEAEFTTQAEWAKLGREVGELRDGDIVVLGNENPGGNFRKGSIVEIHDVTDKGKHFSFNLQGGRTYDHVGNKRWVSELIATKESRVGLTVTK